MALPPFIQRKITQFQPGLLSGLVQGMGGGNQGMQLNMASSPKLPAQSTGINIARPTANTGINTNISPGMANKSPQTGIATSPQMGINFGSQTPVNQSPQAGVTMPSQQAGGINLNQQPQTGIIAPSSQTGINLGNGKGGLLASLQGQPLQSTPIGNTGINMNTQNTNNNDMSSFLKVMTMLLGQKNK